MVIIGGGVIGSEIGQFYSTLGTKVTIVEVASTNIRKNGFRWSKELQRQFKKDKIKVLACVGVQLIVLKIVKTRLSLTLSNGKSVRQIIVLVCTGRKPNLANSGVAEMELELVG